MPKKRGTTPWLARPGRLSAYETQENGELTRTTQHASMAAYEGGARRRPPPPLSKPRAALLALAQQDAEHYLRGAGADGLAEAIRAVAVAAIEEISDETRDPRASSTGAPAAKVSAGAAGAHARVARAQAERIAARDALDDDPLSSALLRAVADEMPAPATAPPAPAAGLRRGPAPDTFDARGLRPRATASGTGGAPPPRSRSAGQNPFAAEPGAFDAPPLGHAPLRGPTASAPLRGVGGDREPRNLTEIERETWRRHVEDLRRGLEGAADAPAAAYAFGGVFSCEMYGSSEQRDQHDELYTEYVLRCRWGRTVDATRPWLVGRRFSEFAALDASLRGAYPSLTFPALPSSYVLFPLDPAVVEEREAGLGAYLGALLRDLPELLKTRHVDEFLQVSARIREVH